MSGHHSTSSPFDRARKPDASRASSETKVSATKSTSKSAAISSSSARATPSTSWVRASSDATWRTLSQLALPLRDGGRIRAGRPASARAYRRRGRRAARRPPPRGSPTQQRGRPDRRQCSSVADMLGDGMIRPSSGCGPAVFRTENMILPGLQRWAGRPIVARLTAGLPSKALGDAHCGVRSERPANRGEQLGKARRTDPPERRALSSPGRSAAHFDRVEVPASRERTRAEPASSWGSGRRLRAARAVAGYARPHPLVRPPLTLRVSCGPWSIPSARGLDRSPSASTWAGA